jgi:hypothetical protein
MDSPHTQRPLVVDSVVVYQTFYSNLTGQLPELLTAAMCVFSGALAMRRLRTADPAGIC